ncbi:TraB/GumN family protein [Brevundimonas subvibrioides]|uniref:GumN family protein n=1 Tax=Brevundimonas subvibrioides (strain ATCC 15264 / DSM 4735 / LMG 14903 / NBRC 16000 / CB 81) TaxID=633149 RepID=D9QLD1_BRESC|nr:TraB/GumN family protein [Brevundimonas subvibrioides]ADK99986.1 GumN family protein [Brevundimonas subvibrioides ATCC 15264]
MTLASYLKTSIGQIARLATGTALGLGLTVSLLSVPGQAFAQAAAPAAPRTVVQAQGQGPALWVVRDADSTLYLFGTVHVLRPETAWGTARVDAAFDSADRVILEISNPDDQAAIQPLIQQYGLSPDRPLSSLLTPAELTRLDAAAQTIGATAAQLDPLRPWLVGLSLSIAPLVKAGYDPQSGVEMILKARAEAAGKPISGFETIDKQVSILAGLSEETQLAFLRATLEKVENATAELDALVGAWATGDVASIERLGVTEMRNQSEEIYQALLVRRNTDWAGQIQTLLEGSGTVFIAVGSAHLAGDDSVQAILEQRGVAVTRE